MAIIDLAQGNNLLRQFYAREIKLHFRHVKSIRDKEQGKYLGFSAGGVQFGTEVNWKKFLLCGCYIGFAKTSLEKHHDALVPVDLVKKLYDFRQTMIIGSNPLGAHMALLKKAFELIGYEVTVSLRNVFFLDIAIVDKLAAVAGKADQAKHIRFLKNGVEDDILLGRMMYSLYWFV